MHTGAVTLQRRHVSIDDSELTGELLRNINSLRLRSPAGV
jgi:hypothetical protein